jgi:hypothetical protein
MFFFSAMRERRRRRDAAIRRLQTQMELAMSQISDLQADIAKQDSVIASAVTLINGFADRLKAAGTDADALASLRAEIGASTNALAAAVAANTPGAPSDNSQNSTSTSTVGDNASGNQPSGTSSGSGMASDGQASGAQGSPSAPANTTATGDGPTAGTADGANNAAVGPTTEAAPGTVDPDTGKVNVPNNPGQGATNFKP